MDPTAPTGGPPEALWGGTPPTIPWQANNLSESDEYIGTEIDGRNTFTNWKKSMTEQELREMIYGYVASHQDEQAAEERWRTKMLKRITSAVAESHASLDERLAAQQAALDQVQAGLSRLLGDAPPPSHAPNGPASCDAPPVEGAPVVVEEL